MADESKDPGTTTEAPEETATAAAEPETPTADEAKADEAEEPKAEEPKAEADEAEEPKAEADEAEEPKAEADEEEPKAEEPKAEEPKAEEKKAEEPKAEEPKAEEKKAEAKPKKKSEVKAKLEQAKNKKKTRRIGEQEEEEKSAQEIFLENLPTIVVVALIFIVVPLLWTSRQHEQGRVSEKAWQELGEAKQQRGLEPFADLVKRHKNTQALPYIKITWASRLYETGEKAKVEQARDLLKDVLRDYGENDFIKRVVPGQIEKIEAELNNPKTPWKPAGQAPISGDPDKALGPDIPAGHSEDDGHDHGKKTAKKTG